MNRWKLAIAFLSCIFIFGPSISCGDELADDASMESAVTAAIRNGDFERLEELSSHYRTTEARTSSGLWKLSLFDARLRAALDIPKRDGQRWTSMITLVEEWVKRHPGSAGARLGYAQMLLSRAWSYRGNGYATTVAKEDWKPFREFTQRARRYLEKTKNVAARDPRWYEIMIAVATYQSWPKEQFDALLKEALDRYPDFYQIYFASIIYLSPKWGGDASSIEQFAREAVERTRKTEGDGMYARIYWYASQTQFGDELFLDSKVDWTLMKKGIDDVLAKYPDAWNTNNFARFACLRGDKEKTAELIERIGPEPLMQVWQTRRNYDRCSRLGESRSARIINAETDAVGHIAGKKDHPPLRNLLSLRPLCRAASP
jgi:hypothetical protein